MMDHTVSTNDDQFANLVYDLAAFLPSAPDADFTCFAAQMSGLYRSDDAGHTWQFMYDALNLSEPLPTFTVAAAHDSQGRMIVLAGISGGILRSDDGGYTWEKVFLPTPPATITDLLLSPDYAEDSLVFAGTLDDGLYYSANLGLTWQHCNFGLLDYHVFCVAASPKFTDNKTLFVGTQSGIFKKTGEGCSWLEVDMPMGYTSVLSIAVSPDGVLYAGTEEHGLWQMQDDGNIWRQIAKDTFGAAIDKIVLASDKILVLTQGQILVSKDDGATWNLWQEDHFSGSQITTIHVSPVSILVGDIAGQVIVTE